MNLTITEVARKGGKAVWRDITKEERSRRMKKLANKRWKGHKKVINSAGLPVKK